MARWPCSCTWEECTRWAQSNGHRLCSQHYRTYQEQQRFHDAKILANIRNNFDAASAKKTSIIKSIIMITITWPMILNDRWGFRQISRGPDASAFCHNLFQCDIPRHCQNNNQQQERSRGCVCVLLASGYD